MSAYLGRLLLCGLAFMAGTGVSGSLLPRLGVQPPPLPPGTKVATIGAYTALGSVFLALALAQVAAGITGSLLGRWLVIAFLAWVAYGVNSALEASIFTVSGKNAGGALFTLLYSLVASLAMASAVAWLFPAPHPGAGFLTEVNAFFAGRSPGEWAWRLAASVAAFPAIYYLFGALVSPLVIGYYTRNAFGLALPERSRILLVQAARSPLFLLAVLPVLITWYPGRPAFLTLGLALFALVGWTPLLVAYWLPVRLRVVHGAEILADSVVYAWVVTRLLAR